MTDKKLHILFSPPPQKINFGIHFGAKLISDSLYFGKYCGSQPPHGDALSCVQQTHPANQDENDDELHEPINLEKR